MARRTAYRLKAPVVLEHPRQVAICKGLTIEIAPAGKVSLDGVVWWAIDHANYAGEVPGVRIGRGIVAGVFDLFFCWLGFAGKIEIKTDAGQMSDAQMSIGSAVFTAGGKIAVARDLDDVLVILDAWSVPRRHMIEPTRRAA